MVLVDVDHSFFLMWQSVTELWQGSSTPSPSSSSPASALAVAAQASDAEAWNRTHCGFVRQPVDIRTAIMLHVDDERALMACRLACRFLAADLGPRSALWERWLARALTEGRWPAFVINWRVPRTDAPTLWAKLVGEDGAGVAPSGFPPASLMPVVLANVAENRRRVVASSASVDAGRPAPLWRTRPGLLDRLRTASPFVPIFGNALETTARKLVYRLMWGKGDKEPPLFPVAGAFPGQSGMGGGVAFHLRGAQVRLAPFYSWDKEIRESAALAAAIESSDGLTFVVDDGVVETPTEQESMRRVIGMVLAAAKPHVPVLVLSFSAHQGHHCNPRRVLQLLNLDAMVDRPVCVRNVPESTDTGVAEGFDWLVQAILH